MADRYVPFPPFAEWAGLSVEDDAFRQLVSLLAADRETAPPDVLDRAVRIATRYAAVDTGAIEGLYQTDRGFTKTVALETAAWEAAAETRGPKVADFIRDQLAAYESVLDLATHARPLTEHYVRQLHEIVCASQDTYVVQTPVGPQPRALPKGTYKTDPNSPTNPTTGETFHYAPPDETPAEMHRFVTEVSSAEFLAAHPVLQAAYLHYAYVCVHPFPDGNGRVARALASIPLYREAWIPFFVFADQRDAYFDALQAADAGRPADFVEFVRERAVDTISLVRAALKAGGGSGATDRLHDLLTVRDGRTYADLDAAAAKIRDALLGRLEARTIAAGLPSGVGLQLGDERHETGHLPQGYRIVHPVRPLVFVASSGSPVRVHVRSALTVAAAETTALPPLAVTSTRRPEEPLQVELRDVEPVLSGHFDVLLDFWLDAEQETLLSALADEVEQRLLAQGL